jgi:hypothetical protein
MRKVIVIAFILTIICSGVVLVADFSCVEPASTISNPEAILATLQELVPTEAEAKAISNLRKKSYILAQQKPAKNNPSKMEPLPTESAPVNENSYNQISIESCYISVSEPLAKMIISNAALSWSGLPFPHNPQCEHAPSGTYISKTTPLPIQVRFLGESNAKKFMEMIFSSPFSKVMLAPKITFFSGQDASIDDIVERPFVTSVLPVEGETAVTYQPFVQIFNEGLTISCKATLLQDDSCRLEKCNAEFTQFNDTKIYKLVNGDNNQFKYVSNTKKSRTDGAAEETKSQGVSIQCPSIHSLSVAIPEITIPHDTSLLVALPGMEMETANGNHAVFLLVTPRVIHSEKQAIAQHNEPEIQR